LGRQPVPNDSWTQADTGKKAAESFKTLTKRGALKYQACPSQVMLNPPSILHEYSATNSERQDLNPTAEDEDFELPPLPPFALNPSYVTVVSSPGMKLYLPPQSSSWSSSPPNNGGGDYDSDSDSDSSKGEEVISYSFSCPLPPTLSPSFRIMASSLSYRVSIVAHLKGTGSPLVLHVPFEVVSDWRSVCGREVAEKRTNTSKWRVTWLELQVSSPKEVIVSREGGEGGGGEHYSPAAISRSIAVTPVKGGGSDGGSSSYSSATDRTSPQPQQQLFASSNNNHPQQSTSSSSSAAAAATVTVRQIQNPQSPPSSKNYAFNLPIPGSLEETNICSLRLRTTGVAGSPVHLGFSITKREEGGGGVNKAATILGLSAALVKSEVSFDPTSQKERLVSTKVVDQEADLVGEGCELLNFRLLLPTFHCVGSGGGNGAFFGGGARVSASNVGEAR
jgi:hypothetical protein